MILKIISLICTALVSFSVGAFIAFVVFKLRKIDSQTDSIPKNHWSMGIYMNDIPQTKQNTEMLDSVPLKIYDWGECSDFPVPRKGEEIDGVYHSGENRFWMAGIVEDVSYIINGNMIVVECKCIDICKIQDNLK